MDDHELNGDMARLCGIPFIVYFVKDSYGGEFPYVTRSNGDYLLVSKDSEVAWDPVNRIEQVWEYVIPALLVRNCDVNILHSSNLGDSVEVTEWDPSWKMPDEDLSRRAAAKDGRLTPRLVCEAVLEAHEKLEETT